MAKNEIGDEKLTLSNGVGSSGVSAILFNLQKKMGMAKFPFSHPHFSLSC